MQTACRPPRRVLYALVLTGCALGTPSGVLDSGPGLLCAAPATGRGPLVWLEVLVDGEEVLDLLALPGFEVLQRGHAPGDGVADGDREHLGVRPLLVLHPEDADRPDADVTAGERGVRHQDESVQGVAVLRQGVGEVAVVRRVAGGGEEAAVEEDRPGLVVVLVLVPAATGYLDDDDIAVRHWTQPYSCGAARGMTPDCEMGS